MLGMARRKPTTDELYGIRRVQRKNCLGWSVELHRNGDIFRKTFTLFRFGTDEDALSAAQAWRDDVALTARPTTLAEYSSLHRSNNTSGHPGVYLMRTTKLDIHGHERVHVAWEARSPNGLKPARKRSFAVLRYGHQEAYDMAVQAREAFVSELEGFLQRQVPKHLQLGSAPPPTR